MVIEVIEIFHKFTGIYDISLACGDGQTIGTGIRLGYGEETDFPAAEAVDLVDLHTGNLLLLQHPGDFPGSKGGCVDIGPHLSEQMGQRPHDIIMTMGDEDCLYPVFLVLEPAEVLDDVFNAQGLTGVRELQSRLDNVNVFAGFHHQHVLSVFVKAAQRHDFHGGVLFDGLCSIILVRHYSPPVDTFLLL